MKYSKYEIIKAPNGESFVYNNGDYKLGLYENDHLEIPKELFFGLHDKEIRRIKNGNDKLISSMGI